MAEISTAEQAAEERYELLGHLLVGRRSVPSMDEEEWGRLIALARVERVAPLLAHALRRAPAGAVPAAVRQGLTAMHREAACVSLRQQASRKRICHILEDLQVPVILLKGTALAFTYYEDPTTRLMGDLDLLVPSAQIEAAARSLVARGFHFRSGSLAEELRRERSHVICVDDATGVTVEVHWELKGLGGRHREAVEAIWAGAQPVVWESKARIMRPAHLIVHLCAHMTIQHKYALLQGLYDLHRVLESIDAGELEIVCKTAAGWGLAPSVALTLLRVRQMFGTPLSPEAVRWSHTAAGEGSLQARVSALALGLGPAERPHDRMLDFMLKQSGESFFRFLFPSVTAIRAQLGLAADERVPVVAFLSWMGKRLQHTPGHLRRTWRFCWAVQQRRYTGSRVKAASSTASEEMSGTR